MLRFAPRKLSPSPCHLNFFPDILKRFLTPLARHKPTIPTILKLPGTFRTYVLHQLAHQIHTNIIPQIIYNQTVSRSQTMTISSLTKTNRMIFVRGSCYFKPF